jgi:hypothetical protein
MTYYDMPTTSGPWWRWCPTLMDHEQNRPGRWELVEVNRHDNGRCFTDPYGDELTPGTYLPCNPPERPLHARNSISIPTS